MAQLKDVSFTDNIKFHMAKTGYTKAGAPRVSLCFKDQENNWIWVDVVYSNEKAPEVFQHVMQNMLPVGTYTPQCPNVDDALAFVKSVDPILKVQPLYAKMGTNERGYRVTYVNRSQRY